MESTAQLSDLQFAVMRVIWSRGEATVVDVHTALQRERGLAMTTVATVLSRLEKRGLVKHRSAGRQYVYQATVTESQVRRSMIRDLTERLFEGDVTELVHHLLSERDISAGDLETVKRLIEEKERKGPGPGKDSQDDG